MAEHSATHPRVLISYSQESAAHNTRVADLAGRLRRDGIDCSLDQYEVSPPEGWPRWMVRQIATSNHIVVVCSQTYYRRALLSEEVGKGRGMRYESLLIDNALYWDDSLNTRFIPVLFDGRDADYIPDPLRGSTYYRVDTEDGYTSLLRQLTDQPAMPKPPLGSVPHLPPRERAERVSSDQTPEAEPPDRANAGQMALGGLACPHCRREEWAQRAAAIVAQETLRVDDGDTTSVRRSRLAAMLRPPLPSFPLLLFEEDVSCALGLGLFLLLSGLGLWYWPGMRAAPTLDWFATRELQVAVLSLWLLVVTLLALVATPIVRRQRVERELALRAYDELFYCRRCHLLFFPGEEASSSPRGLARTLSSRAHASLRDGHHGDALLSRLPV